MKKVNFNKQMQGAYQNYLNSEYYRLDHLYENYSIYKARAYEYCQSLYNQYNGYDFKLLGGNCMTFSAGFCYNDKNNQKHFVWITKTYDKDCIINE